MEKLELRPISRAEQHGDIKTGMVFECMVLIEGSACAGRIFINSELSGGPTRDPEREWLGTCRAAGAPLGSHVTVRVKACHLGKEIPHRGDYAAFVGHPSKYRRDASPVALTIGKPVPAMNQISPKVSAATISTVINEMRRAANHGIDKNTVEIPAAMIPPPADKNSAFEQFKKWFL